MSEADPFTQVYNAVWTMIDARPAIEKLVRKKNRITFAEDLGQDPIKSTVATTDLPELALVPGSTVPHLQRTGNSSSLIETMTLEVSTGDLRVHKSLFPLKWELLRAFATWQDVLSALTWNGKKFVKLAKPTEVFDGMFNAQQNRGIKGWSSIWTCSFEMWFFTADLQENS